MSRKRKRQAAKATPVFDVCETPPTAEDIAQMKKEFETPPRIVYPAYPIGCGSREQREWDMCDGCY